jgi:hypothetical protein
MVVGTDSEDGEKVTHLIKIGYFRTRRKRKIHIR